jgi:tRNA nucleotidyltransferase (CCA-adding enzyme)
MLRAIRFANQLDFEIETKSFQSITKNAERIKIISGERIVEELNKTLTAKNHLIFIALQNRPFRYILPELTALNQVEEIEGQTHKNNFYHTLEVVEYLPEYG